VLKRRAFLTTILTFCTLSFSATAAAGARFEGKNGTYPDQINETGAWFVLVSQGVGDEFRVLCEKGDKDKGELKEISRTLEYVPTYEKCIIELKKAMKNEAVNASVKGCTYKLLEPSSGSIFEPESTSAFEGPFEILGGSSCEIAFVGRESKCRVTVHGQSRRGPVLYKDTSANELEMQLVGSKGVLYSANECAGVESGTREAYELAELNKFSQIKLAGLQCTLPYCEPTITPGVRLNIPLNAQQEAQCTAGPIMTKGSETFLLTAGHCFGKVSERTEPIKQKVQSVDPKEFKGFGKEIGENVEFNNSGDYDIAEVKIENGEWLLEGGSALPVLVEWAATPKAPSVIAQASNLVGEETCHTGAASGAVLCGEILRKGDVETDHGEVKNLFETTVTGQGGDSGGPEFVRSKGGLILIQGVYLGGAGSKAIRGPGNLTKGGKEITGYPKETQRGKTACQEITDMEKLWKAPVEGEGVPAKTTVTKCKIEANNTATIEMSAAATKTGRVEVTIGHTTLGAYEPMRQVEAVYVGQTLLVRK
jgi:hypothetical protein